MRLLMLPGLNGSSGLFAPLLARLDPRLQAECLDLPTQGPQDHDSLSRHFAPRLRSRNESFVLLGESFSSPLVHRLALDPPAGLRGVVFAAGFLGSPQPLMRLLPWGSVPLPKGVLTRTALLRLFCLGRDASPEQLEALRMQLLKLPDVLLRARLRSLSQLAEPRRSLTLPALHLRPGQDRLVKSHAGAALGRHCTELQGVTIKGPHFILQQQPDVCAEAIERFIGALQAR
ncbi:MAG: alpha/beta hydrolase [Pseudomonas sp.]|uniref:alpha/beta fold hydrolase n=1 Tax=Pseudomonas sp. TaxID=306 RepID=UPI0033974450